MTGNNLVLYKALVCIKHPFTHNVIYSYRYCYYKHYNQFTYMHVCTLGIVCIIRLNICLNTNYY